MVRYLVPKKGVPVLASARVDGAAQSCCVLVAKYCDAPLQISFYLQYTNFIHGFDDPQTFTLIYDADDLTHGATTLKTATTLLPHHQLASIARAGNPQIRVLTFTLAKPCRIRCPPSASTGNLAAKSGFEAPFHQLVKLAEATEIDILLDYNWVHADNREPLERFFRQPNLFAGFPDGNDRSRYVDWTDFNTIEEYDAPPPSYAKAVDTDASRKRSRHGKSFRAPADYTITIDTARSRHALLVYVSGFETSPVRPRLADRNRNCDAQPSSLSHIRWLTKGKDSCLIQLPTNILGGHCRACIAGRNK